MSAAEASNDWMIGVEVDQSYLSTSVITSAMKDLASAVQPTRGLDVGAIEFIHKQLIALRDQGKAVLLVSLELDEVMSLSDRILVMYEGELVGQLDPQITDEYELGLYMSGSKRDEVSL